MEEIAKKYGWSSRKMNNFLCDQGVQYKDRKIWRMTYEYEDKAYMIHIPKTVYDYRGKTHIQRKTFWTEKGVNFIDKLMKENGYIK